LVAELVLDPLVAELELALDSPVAELELALDLLAAAKILYRCLRVHFQLET
jgi:hypothetical protein